MDKKVVGKLFQNALILSAFTFGGGFVIIPLMKEKFVDELGWIKENEMMDLISIAQSSPGSLSVNISILVGYRLAGIVGSLVSVVATIIPPLFIITLVSIFYEYFISNPIVLKVLLGMNIGVAAILVDVAYNLGKSVIIDFKYYSILIIIATLYAFYKNVNIMIIVFVGGFVGLIYFTYLYRSKLLQNFFKGGKK